MTVKGILTFGLVMILTFSIYSISRADIVAMWLFDEGSGNIAQDSSGNGHDGNLMNGPVWVDGKFGKALEFDGVDDYVDPGAFSITYNNAYTAMVWVYPTELRFEQTIGRGQSWDDRPGDIQLRIEDDQGHLKPHLWAGSWVVFQSDGTIPANEWSHLSVTFDGTTLLLYINGELDSASATAAGPADDTDNDNPAFIGCYLDQDGVSTGSHYVGLMDEVMYADYAMTQDEVKNAMEGLATVSSVTPGSKITTTWGEVKNQ